MAPDPSAPLPRGLRVERSDAQTWQQPPEETARPIAFGVWRADVRTPGAPLWNRAGARADLRSGSQSLNLGFRGTRNTSLSAPQKRKTDQFQPPQAKKTHTWTPPLRCPFPVHPRDGTLRGVASVQAFVLVTQPRPEPPGAARSSGEPAPQRTASTSALLGALYLLSGEATE